MQSLNKKAISRIYGRGRGWAFSPNDFVEDFSRDQIENALAGLCREGRIRRVCRGIYDYPKFSELLQLELSPDFDQVAQAFARKFNWRIQPSGDAAMNLLGLSTQVPGRLVYLSDGPNRQYDVGNYTLEFKKSALKDVGFKYRESGLIVQALKALGQERVDDAVIATLRKQLDETACKRVLKDTVTATGWVYEAIKRVSGHEQHKQNMANQAAHKTVRDKTRLMDKTYWHAMKKRAERIEILDRIANSNRKN